MEPEDDMHHYVKIKNGNSLHFDVMVWTPTSAQAAFEFAKNYWRKTNVNVEKIGTTRGTDRFDCQGKRWDHSWKRH